MKNKLDIIIYLILFVIVGIVAYIFLFSSVSVKRLELDKTEITLFVGSKNRINVTIVPDNAEDKTIKWKSNNESVVMVDDNGVITGKKEGITIVRVFFINKIGQKIEKQCNVTVYAKKVINFEIFC